MKRCPRCFECKTQDNWQFCPRCGAELETVQVEHSPARVNPSAAAELLESLQAILERADYIDGDCRPVKPVCVALPVDLIRRARAAVMRARQV